MSTLSDFLKNEHTKVDTMFVEFQDNNDANLAIKICDELDTHTAMEEAILYPVLKEVDLELYEHSIEEHNAVKPIIEKVRFGDGYLISHMSEMKQKVEHHVKEEEGKDIPRLEGALDEATLNSLVEDMKAFKQKNA